MSKIYNPKKGVYAVPDTVYLRMVYLVKDYPRMCMTADSLLDATPPQTETPEIQRQRNIKATETNNLKYAAIMSDIRDVEAALTATVPPESQKAILHAIINNTRYPIDKDRRTYTRYKQHFIYELAKRRNLI